MENSVDKHGSFVRLDGKVLAQNMVDSSGGEVMYQLSWKSYAKKNNHNLNQTHGKVI